MSPTTVSTITDLASRQNGVVARRQLRAAGIRSDTVHRWIEAGRLVALSPRVLRVAGAPADDRSMLAAAVLDAGSGSALSHGSAAARWGLPGFDVFPAHVTSGRMLAATPDALGVVHRPRRILPGHIIGLDDLPITTPTRTVFDLAGMRSTSIGRLARVIDTALARRLVSTRSLARMLDELAVRGRPGITVMRHLLAERPVSYAPPESGLEAAFEKLARQSGLLEFERQVDAGDDEGWIGRVDFMDRRRRLIVEVGDGLFHGSLTDKRHDRTRHDALRRAGWRVEEVDAIDVFQRRTALVERLRLLAAGGEGSGASLQVA